MLISEIIEATNGKLLNGHLDDQVNGFTQDTRVIQPGNLYIPLVGIKDGHDYIPQAFEKVQQRLLQAILLKMIHIM